MTVIRKDIFSDTSALVHPFTHVLSDESVDSYGDVIRQRGWELQNYRANPILLDSHKSHEPPIGMIPDLQIRDGKLYGRVEMAAKGTSQRIDELRALMGLDGGSRILKGVSVGFFALESRPRTDSNKGTEFLRQRLVEVSLCSVPANSNALAIARSMGISRATMAKVFNNGSLVSTHIASARKAVAQQHQYSATVANIERKIEALWIRIGEALTEPEQKALIKQLRTLEKSATLLTPEHLRTADQKRSLQLGALAAEQARNDPWGTKARAAESLRRSTETTQRMEREYIAMQKAQGTYIDPTPTRSGNIVTWRGQKIDLTPTWRGKKIY